MSTQFTTFGMRPACLKRFAVQLIQPNSRPPRKVLCNMNNGCPQLFQEPLPRCVGKRLSMRGSMRSTDMRAPLNQLRAGGAGLRLTFVPHFDAASATSRMLRLGGKCYTWEVQKPLIALVCYGVTLGKAVFGGVRGGKVQCH